MAAPITHIVITDKVYTKYFSNKDRKEFYVGTSLPDIRYLGVVERDKTHYRNPSLKDILNNNSFDAGLKFHSLVDEVREQFMRKNNYYSLFPKSELQAQAAKVLEDRVLYDKVDNWSEIISFFDKTYKGELDLGIGNSDVKRWHQLLKVYFTSKPEDKDTIAFTTSMGFPQERAKEIVTVIKGSDTKSAKKVVLDFYNNFENLI